MNAANSDHEAKMTSPGTQRYLRMAMGRSIAIRLANGYVTGAKRNFPGVKRDLNQHFFRFFTRSEVGAVRMVEYERANARLGLHHHALGELYADFVRLQQFPDALLIIQIGTCRIPKAVALAAIARSEALLHGHGGRVGEAPVLTDAAVQPLGAALGSLDGQRLQGVRFEI